MGHTCLFIIAFDGKSNIYVTAVRIIKLPFKTFPYNFVIVMQSLRVRKNFSRDVEADSLPKSPVSKRQSNSFWEH